MADPDTVRVKHIGKRDRRADTMSGEGTVWHGEGDVQTVSRKAWDNHLRRYPDLWVLAEDATPPAAEPEAPIASTPAAPSPAAPDFDGMDRQALAKLAASRGITFDGRTSKARLIELLTA